MKIKQTGGIKRKRAGVSKKMVCFTCRKCFHSGITHCVQCNNCVGLFHN